ncbi:MAG: hypothetical protein ACI9WU_004827, partial [Myxococcota bacterium]
VGSVFVARARHAQAPDQGTGMRVRDVGAGIEIAAIEGASGGLSAGAVGSASAGDVVTIRVAQDCEVLSLEAPGLPDDPDFPCISAPDGVFDGLSLELIGGATARVDILSLSLVAGADEQAGLECTAGCAAGCADGDLCTTDSCGLLGLCVHVQNTEPCDDGLACSVADTCAQGTCLGVPKVCPGPEADQTLGFIDFEGSSDPPASLTASGAEVIAGAGVGGSQALLLMTGVGLGSVGLAESSAADIRVTLDLRVPSATLVGQATLATLTLGGKPVQLLADALDPNAFVLHPDDYDQTVGTLAADQWHAIEIRYAQIGWLQVLVNGESLYLATTTPGLSGSALGIVTGVVGQPSVLVDNLRAQIVHLECTAEDCTWVEAACVTATGCVEPGGSCAHVLAEGIDCGQGNICAPAACQAGVCVVGATTCQDGDSCTLDLCQPLAGCDHPPKTCTDGDACTDDQCWPASGCSHAAVACGDGDACQDDQCNVILGCYQVPADCDDGSVCTLDQCASDSGCSNSPVDCSDGDACTVDTCDPTSGCAISPATSAVGHQHFMRAWLPLDGGGLNNLVGSAATFPEDGADAVPGFLAGAIALDATTWAQLQIQGPQTGGFTTAAYVKVAASGTARTLVAEASPSGWWCGLDPLGRLVLEVGGETRATSTAVVDDNAWHHVACARGGDGSHSVYVDGAVAIGVTSAPEDLTGFVTLSLGRCALVCDAGGAAPRKALNGALDSVRIWGADIAFVPPGMGIFPVGPEDLCHDGQGCHQPVCDPAGGCDVILAAGLCDDGDPCTSDECEPDGSCVGVPVLDCDDLDVCTDDTCTPDALGCVHSVNEADCDDNSPCTLDDMCSLGSCGPACVPSEQTWSLDALEAGQSFSLLATIGANLVAAGGTFRFSGQYTEWSGASVTLGVSDGSAFVALADLPAASPPKVFDDWRIEVDRVDARARLVRDTPGPWHDLGGLGASWMFAAQGVAGPAGQNAALVVSSLTVCGQSTCDDGDTCTADQCQLSIGCVHSALAEPGCVLDGFDQALRLNLFEPASQSGAAGTLRPAASLVSPAVETGGSAWVRAQEPVEIPLINAFDHRAVLGHWPLDAVPGSVVGQPAVLGGAVAGSAVVFDQAGLVLESERSWRFGEQFTVGVWVRATGASGTIASTDAGEKCLSGGWELLLSAGELQFRTVWSGETQTITAPLPTDAQWHHVAVVRHGGEAWIYVDGV